MKLTKKPFTLYPIDQTAITVCIGLAIITLLLMLSGVWCSGNSCLVHIGPKVREFTWNNKVINAKDQAFLLKFSRPMDRRTVERNLSFSIPEKPELTNPLPGRISWAGRRMAYTLNFPAPYGNEYQMSLKGAKEDFQGNQEGQTMLPFEGTFKTPDRVLAYIGLKDDERGRLILYNITQQKKEVLTASDLVVTEFKPYAGGEYILLSATDKQETKDGLLEQKLYKVSTGLSNRNNGNSDEVPGQLELVLDNEEYRNLKFDLSEDGKTIVVQRVHREDPNDLGLWIIQEEGKPTPLNNTPGGVFMIAPDSQTIASTQGEGIALLSLEPDAEPLEFLAQFGMVLTFSPDGGSAVMVDFNKNNPDKLYTRSLFLVNNQGGKEKILDTQGSVISCEFAPTGDRLYCLLTNLIEDVEYIEQPYIAAIDLEDKQEIPLMTLPSYQDIHLSLAPDGLGLLFDQIVTDPEATGENILKTNSGEAIENGQLWLLIPPTILPSEDAEETPPNLEELPFVGFHPQWIP